jgi:hypothetical protein
MRLRMTFWMRLYVGSPLRLIGVMKAPEIVESLAG